MTAPEQTEFVKNHLGPAFRKAHVDTKIIVYDHNADRPDYPISILNDTAARKYIDGSAFHLYAGTIDALSLVHNAHPDKHLYFTEQWIGAPGDIAGDIPWHIENLIIGGTRNWCKTVLEWNLASDPQYRPHTDNGGCVNCLGAVTIGDSTVIRNPAYYIVAHASKFARPGSVRIASNTSTELPNTAFRTPDGRTVLIVLNTTKANKTFNILYKGKLSKIELNGRAVGTYIW
jgi:glucosylceramidase